MFTIMRVFVKIASFQHRVYTFKPRSYLSCRRRGRGRVVGGGLFLGWLLIADVGWLAGSCFKGTGDRFSSGPSSPSFSYSAEEMIAFARVRFPQFSSYFDLVSVILVLSLPSSVDSLELPCFNHISTRSCFSAREE